ncbi:hypothetical protein CVS28_08310 [Arthrobacter glacialis]|nr:hypothetical protein CVS28_08310 [Arthrobacter glacialis]
MQSCLWTGGFLFWLPVLVVVHSELCDEPLQLVILLKTHRTELQQFGSAALAPTPFPIGSVHTDLLPTLLLFRDCIRHCQVGDGRYLPGLLTPGLRISYNAIGPASLVWITRPFRTREWSSGIQDQHVLVVAQVPTGEVGMPDLDQLGGHADFPVWQVGACGVRECRDPCLVQPFRGYRHRRWLVAFGFKDAK